ncbi:MAG: hypothetical protein RR365_08565 [Bacteroides sp.]
MKKILILMVILCLMFSSMAFTFLPSGVVVTEFEHNEDYAAKMIDAAKDGSEYALHMGAIYEQQRNMKIDDLNSNYDKTNFFDGRDPGAILASLMSYFAAPTHYTDNDAIMIAKIMYNEARGIDNKIELACVAWTILNRVDAGYGSIYQVITAPNQFAYSNSAPTVNDHGVDLLDLSRDVLNRWSREKNGETDVGRVLPLEYKYYGGHSGHNWFRTSYNNFKNLWDYSLPSPYED